MKQTEPSYIELAKEIITYFPHIQKNHEQLIADLIEANQNGDLYLPVKAEHSIDIFKTNFLLFGCSRQRNKTLFSKDI